MENSDRHEGIGKRARKGQSRRRFLTTSAGAAAALGAAIEAGPAAVVVSGQVLFGQNPAPSAGDEITLALVNGKIHTMDAANTVANSVTIRNGRFVRVGGPKPK